MNVIILTVFYKLLINLLKNIVHYFPSFLLVSATLVTVLLGVGKECNPYVDVVDVNL